MAVLTKDDLMTRISEYIGEDNSDNAISLLEDFSDTIEDFASRSDGEDWKGKYEELDKSWRDRYIARFKNIATDPDTSEVIEVEQVSNDAETEEIAEGENVTIDDLFTDIEED